jgi:hypothetical protein
MKRTAVLLLVLWLTPASALAASSEPEPAESRRLTSTSAVSITDRGDYYQVLLDYTHGATPRQMGEEYGRAILRMVPDFGHLLDSYLVEMVPQEFYPTLMERVDDLKPQVHHEYREELAGLASAMAGTDRNVLGDDLLSAWSGNASRWNSIRNEILARGDTVAFEDVRAIATFHTGTAFPGSQEDGNVYHSETQQILLFRPADMHVEVFFRPKTGELPQEPEFHQIEVLF